MIQSKHIAKYLFIITIVIILLNNILYSFDPSFYFVPLKKVSKQVYLEDKSKFKMIINDSISLPDTSTQRTIGNTQNKNNYSIIIETGNNTEFNKQKSGDKKKHLVNTRLLNMDDPIIIKLKERFKNSKNILDEVEKFVNEHINNKIIGLPIIPASEILKNKSGDCTEHTILAISILRSLGIPARGVMGMLLSEEFSGNKDVFVYHMWGEAYTNGKWNLLDATRPGIKHANRYIAFVYHHLQTEMPLSYLKAVSAMKTLSVEYVE